MSSEPTPLGPASPGFIVSDIAASLTHYVDRLRFTCTYLGPSEKDLFFAMVSRGSAQFLLKVVDDSVQPLPNRARHEWAPWDAFVFADDPDALAAEFAGRGVVFIEPLATRSEDNLCGFEVADPDGYVCFFGRPA